jgi:MFS family permease
MAGATLVSTFGNGLFTTISALYFTRIVGLPIATVGVGLTVAGLFGVIASVRFGPVCDRFGSRSVLLVLLVCDALGTAITATVTTFVAFVVVVSLTTICDRGASTARAALYADALPPELRTPARAYLRAVTNVGIGAGAASAAIALHVDTRQAYVCAILVDAATFLAAAVILLGLPSSRSIRVDTDDPEPQHRRSLGLRTGRNLALRDRPYLLVTALCSVLALQFTVLEVGLPLWIVNHTNAPRVMISATLLLNTVFVVLFQVRAARRVTGVRSAGLISRRGALFLGAGWLLIAVCAGLPGWAAALVLIIAMLVETTGEVLTSASGWALSYDLAHDSQHGAYQGVFNGGWALSTMLGPLIVTGVVLPLGIAGWALLAAVFAVAGSAVVPATRWAERARTTRDTEPLEAGRVT